MGQNYNHLTLEDRCRLHGMMEMGLPKTEIVRLLGPAAPRVAAVRILRSRRGYHRMAISSLWLSPVEPGIFR